MNYRNEMTDQLFDAILALQTREDCYRFFEDACTIKEILEIAQRLAAAKMLDEKKSYAVIAKETGMSTATISRVNRCLMYGQGGYRIAIERMAEAAAKMAAPEGEGDGKAPK